MSKLTRLTEPTSSNMMAPFAMKIVGHGWILSGISSKSENFLRTAPRLKAVDLHRLWAHVFPWGGSSENLCNQAKRTALFIELSIAMRTEELLFSWDMPILKRTNRSSSRAFRFYLALNGMMPAYSCNHICWTQLLHLRLFTGQLMAALTSATWWRMAAHMSVLWQSCFETMLLQQAEHFQEAFS